MKNIQKILVPVDFSEHSQEALQYTADLSQKFQAAVELIHVYQPVNYALPEGYVFYSSEQLQQLLQALETRLQETKLKAEELGCLQVSTQSLMGSPASEIVRYAEEGKHDLIVMGTHGRTGLSHAFLGSVTEKVVRTAPCPVLTLRAQGE